MTLLVVVVVAGELVAMGGLVTIGLGGCTGGGVGGAGCLAGCGGLVDCLWLSHLVSVVLVLVAGLFVVVVMVAMHVDGRSCWGCCCCCWFWCWYW